MLLAALQIPEHTLTLPFLTVKLLHNWRTGVDLMRDKGTLFLSHGLHFSNAHLLA